MKPKNDKPMINLNIRVSVETAEKITKAVQESGLEQSEILRRAIALGMDEMKHVGFDIEEVYRQAIRTAKAKKQRSKAAPRLSAVPDLAAAPDLDPADPAPVFHLPFLGAVAAGQPVEAPRIDEELPVAKAYPPHHFIVEINGQSMEPDFLDGDRWIVDGREKYTPRHGAVCVVSDGSGSYLKRWDGKRRVFLSINPAFGEIMPEEGSSLQGYPVAKL